jgi:hypothetical protein
MRNDIDKVIEKLFSKYKDADVNSSEFMHQSFDEAGCVSTARSMQTPKDIMDDFLFEETDLGKRIKKLIKEYRDTKQENS